MSEVNNHYTMTDLTADEVMQIGRLRYKSHKYFTRNLVLLACLSLGLFALILRSVKGDLLSQMLIFVDACIPAGYFYWKYMRPQKAFAQGVLAKTRLTITKQGE